LAFFVKKDGLSGIFNSSVAQEEPAVTFLPTDQLAFWIAFDRKQLRMQNRLQILKDLLTAGFMIV